MCLAVPGKIVRIDGEDAIVDYGGQHRSGRLLESGYLVGDYVLIQGGVVIEKIPEEEAKESLCLYTQL